MLQLRVKGSLENTIESLVKINKQIEKADFFQNLAHLLNSSIQRRVQKRGIGTKNTEMGEYSDKYAAYRDRTGRQTRYRDLTYSGNMWNALTAEKQGSGARMFFQSTFEANKARGNENREAFFGISEIEKGIIKTQINKLFEGL